MNTRHLLRIIVPVLLVILLGAAPSAQAQGLVMPIKRRTAILEAVERYLQPMDPQFKEQLAELEYPFAFEAAPVAVEPTATKSAEPEPVVVTYTDQQVLEAFSSKFRPTGMMARGELNYLIIEVGDRTQPIAEGSLIRFNYEGKSYNVRLTSVTDDDYTLRLGEATLVRRINESFDPDQIKRFNPKP